MFRKVPAGAKTLPLQVLISFFQDLSKVFSLIKEVNF